jgi:hypothetical protein
MVPRSKRYGRGRKKILVGGVESAISFFAEPPMFKSVLVCDMYPLSRNEVVEFMCGVRISPDEVCKLECQGGGWKA